ncbi:anaerobic ribonucleoside-triphosphate reductase activating protein [Catenibacillus scindens]|uniref:Anaerobic ribonucleoside-triphosphate reductase-activating protein n=1 Tax=Catenibacillus scindens TaxID=673271 RepID=A0A7W8HAK0_9FIRM|nr:anaerobic ribonucleoside-triphosphate reductase activating protein [Catenibacillus scindens]MBB5264793.1 anaerobic ribonucleoside-triphosphate reductase activating protein [Catenibacillus scindens]
MHYADIKQYDVANGPGVRVSLFVSGCTHHCKNCFNQVTWDFNYGDEFTEKEMDRIIEYLRPDYIRGITLLGGEPMEHTNQQGLLPLLRKIRQTYPQKDIWCFTGYDFDRDVKGRMLKAWPETGEFLSYIDVLVDGPFIEEQKSVALRFKGSANQRTIDVKKSMEQGKTVLMEGY